MMDNKIIIKGITVSGSKFRPSDWAQRLTGAVSTLGPGRRIIPHPKIRVVLIEGVPSVVFDQDLEAEEPMLYSFLKNFADSNLLQMETNHHKS